MTKKTNFIKLIKIKLYKCINKYLHKNKNLLVLNLMFVFYTLMSDISTHYGGSILAIKEKDAVMIVNDKRMGTGPITVGLERSSVHKIGNKAYVGFSGFLPDSQGVLSKLKNYVNFFEVNEGREINVEELKNLLSFLLYEERTRSPYYVESIVVGIDITGSPRAFSMDCLGCVSEYHFVSTGTASNNLTGLAETLYTENMSTDDLFTCGMQVFLNAVDRDALSGWGADCYIIKNDQIIKRTVEGRND